MEEYELTDTQDGNQNVRTRTEINPPWVIGGSFVMIAGVTVVIATAVNQGNRNSALSETTQPTENQ